MYKQNILTKLSIIKIIKYIRNGLKTQLKNWLNSRYLSSIQKEDAQYQTVTSMSSKSTNNYAPLVHQSLPNAERIQQSTSSSGVYAPLNTTSHTRKESISTTTGHYAPLNTTQTER